MNRRSFFKAIVTAAVGGAVKTGPMTFALEDFVEVAKKVVTDNRHRTRFDLSLASLTMDRYKKAWQAANDDQTA